MRHLFPALFGLLALTPVACGPTSGSPNTSTPTTTRPTGDERNFQPCHPGCFPAGTLVVTPSGLKEIQTVGKGGTVTIVTADGTATSGAVESVFETCNKLLDLTTDGGTLRTTETQPLCPVAGGFVEAGKLKAGDRIWKWADGRRTAVTVTSVATVEGTSAVFNLVVGEGKVFVANGFLAKGKPPADR